jgi:hypothetical protein
MNCCETRRASLVSRERPACDVLHRCVVELSRLRVRRCVFVWRQKNRPTTQAETVCYCGCAASGEAIRHGISSTILLIG